MPVTAWVMIGIAVATQVFSVVWWLVRRPVGRLDRLEAAVFGETGVHMKLTKFVTYDAFEKRMGTIDSHLRGVSEEGQKREERILRAIENQTLVVGSDVRELREDVREQLREVRQDLRAHGQRTDEVLKASAPQR